MGLRVFVLFCALAASSRADTWPQFRGAEGHGISTDAKLPTDWDEDSVTWAVDLPGRSNSSPAITKHRIDLTTQTDDNSLWVLSFARKDGTLLHKTRVGEGILAAKGAANLYAHRHNAATPSPAADEQNIYAFFGTGLLVCVEAATGEIRWRRDLVQEFGAYDITFGMGSSPRLWGDLLYVPCMTKGPAYVVALNKHSGEVAWQTERKLEADDDGPDAYSTPTVYMENGRRLLLVSGSDHINAYDLLSGKQVWISSGLSIDSPYGRVIASPVASGETVVATTGNPGGGGKGHVIAIGGTKSEDVTTSGRRWKYAKTTPDSSTPLALGDRLYMVTDSGVASCLSLDKGNVIWQKRLSKGPYHASLVANQHNIYFLGIDGNCTVMKAGTQKAEIVATNSLPGTFYATPAISDGSIYLRAYERLYAISSN